MGIVSHAKDRLIEHAILSYLNRSYLAPYGQATSLCLDSKARRIHAEVQLKGESIPIQIEIADYEISQEADRYFAAIKQVRASREWLTTLLTELCRRRFELPSRMGRMLMLTL